jgi:hypothetical protein
MRADSMRVVTRVDSCRTWNQGRAINAVDTARQL